MLDELTFLLIVAIAFPWLALIGHLFVAYVLAPRRIQQWLASEDGKTQLFSQLGPSVMKWASSPEASPMLESLTKSALSHVGPALAAWIEDPATRPMIDGWLETATKKGYDYMGTLIGGEKGNLAQGKATKGPVGALVGLAGGVGASLAQMPPIKTGSPFGDFVISLVMPRIVDAVMGPGPPRGLPAPAPSPAPPVETDAVYV